MNDIANKLKDINKTKFENGVSKYFSREKLKFREWEVLGVIQSLLISAGCDAPSHAVESERPDFATYSPDGLPWAPVEITEILRPDYKRGEFYKCDALSDPPSPYHVPQELDEPWAQLRSQITNKASKASKYYPPETILMVYFDIGRSSFKDRRTPINEMLLKEHKREPFLNLAEFSRVLILTADMKSLVQLHPTAKTIVPDKGSWIKGSAI